MESHIPLITQSNTNEEVQIKQLVEKNKTISQRKYMSMETKENGNTEVQMP